jgi:hypothetical protein
MKPILVIKSPIEQPEGKDFMADVKREYHVLWIYGTYEDFSIELFTVNKAENLSDEKINELMGLLREKKHSKSSLQAALEEIKSIASIETSTGNHIGDLPHLKIIVAKHLCNEGDIEKLYSILNNQNIVRWTVEHTL